MISEMEVEMPVALGFCRGRLRKRGGGSKDRRFDSIGELGRMEPDAVGGDGFAWREAPTPAMGEIGGSQETDR